MRMDLARLVWKCLSEVRTVGRLVVSTVVVNSVVPCVLVLLTVKAVIGTLVGTRMTDSSELRLSSVPDRIGMLSIGMRAPDVSTLGRRVVLLVLVTTVCSLWVVVFVVHLNSRLGAWRVDMICILRVTLSCLRTLVVLVTAR